MDTQTQPYLIRLFKSGLVWLLLTLSIIVSYFCIYAIGGYTMSINYDPEFQYLSEEQKDYFALMSSFPIYFFTLLALLFIALTVRSNKYIIAWVFSYLLMFLSINYVNSLFPYPSSKSGYNGKDGYSYEEEYYKEGPYTYKRWKSVKQEDVIMFEHSTKWVLDSVVVRK